MNKRPWVIKAGGELLVPGLIRNRILSDIRRLSRSHPLVFVHGGGPQIEQELVKNKIPIKFVGGRRFTSPKAMLVVERVLSGQINKGLTAQLVSNGVHAVGLSCRDGGLVSAKPIQGLGRAARPVRVNISLFNALLEKKFVPVVSSVGSDQAGQAVNINADDVASALAVKLRAAHLIFLTNIAGVLDQNKKRIPVLRVQSIDKLIQKSVITGGMIPKVQSARSAIRKGVGEVNILNGKKGINLKTGSRLSPG